MAELKTHCKQGHLLDESNTAVTTGRRRCKTCVRQASRRYKVANSRAAAGDPDLGPVASLFWSKVVKRDGCWDWTGTHNRSGYGSLTVRGVTFMAHRAAYQLTIGPIGADLTIDHRCLNKGCVNPSHMEVVTRAENTRRGSYEVRRYGRPSHCKRGHEMAGSNIYVDGRGGRACRACRSQRTRRSQTRLANELKAAQATIQTLKIVIEKTEADNSELRAQRDEFMAERDAASLARTVALKSLNKVAAERDRLSDELAQQRSLVADFNTETERLRGRLAATAEVLELERATTRGQAEWMSKAQVEIERLTADNARLSDELAQTRQVVVRLTNGGIDG